MSNPVFGQSLLSPHYKQRKNFWQGLITMETRTLTDQYNDDFNSMVQGHINLSFSFSYHTVHCNKIHILTNTIGCQFTPIYVIQLQ